MKPRRLLDFLPLAAQSLIQPRITSRTVLALPVARPDLITFGWLIVVISVLLSQGVPLVLGAERQDVSQFNLMLASLFLAALSIFGGAYLLRRIGASFQGETNFDVCLKAAIWLNFVILLIQIPFPFVIHYKPELFSLITMLVAILTMIQIVSQVMELHGFTKVLPVLLGVLGVQFLFTLFTIVVFQTMGIPIIPVETVQ